MLEGAGDSTTMAARRGASSDNPRATQHKVAQAQAFTTHTETENFSETNEYYFASRVCCLLSSHSLPDDLHVVPAEYSTIILPPDACSMSTASCVTSGTVADTGNGRGVTDNLEYVLNFTDENVQHSGVHGDAIKCAGVIIGFPCVDMHGIQRIISCPDTGSFSTTNRHCLLPVSWLMHYGFKFNYAIPADANQHGFGKYKDYGGTIITPDGIIIVMVHHEHTWKLPTFALPETSSKDSACLPCDPNDTFSLHYSANSFSALNCLDPEKACPQVTCQATTNANIGSATETLAGFSDLIKLTYQSVRTPRATCYNNSCRVEATARSRAQCN